VPTLVVLVVILGFPVVFFLAWHFDVRSDGIYRTERAGLLSRSQSMFLFSFMLVATAGLASVFYQYYSGVFEAASAGPETAERAFAAPQNSIAVLPFADMSQTGDQAYFTDGVSEEILNLLAQVDGLHVAARTSSFAFRGSQKDIREIGRLLNVSTVLEGSVRTSGDRVRLTAQLINVEDGFHIWSKFYDRKLTDIFEIQDEVAENIATALVDSFDGLTGKPASRSDSLAASQAYRTGRLHWWRRTPAELQRAIELFATALEHDSGFAPAYAAMADTWLLLALYGNVSKVRATEKAQSMVEKALELDPESAEAYAALGLARWQIGQYDAAESAFRQAVQLNESYIPAQLWLAGVLGERGRYPEESLVLEKAMMLDPLNELLLVNYAGNLSIRGDWESGRNLLQGLVDLRPDSTILLRSMAKMELANGNLVEGWKLANQAYQLAPENPEDIASLARIWVLLGDLDEAERLVLKGLETSNENAGLLSTHWMTLMISRRFEEANSLVRERMAKFGDQLPEAVERNFMFQLGMVAMAREDYPLAREYLTAAIGDEDELIYNGDQFLTLTMAALAAARTGNEAQSEMLLGSAERSVRRARLNGVDNPGIYYTEAVLLSMNEQHEQAMVKLLQAYDRGYRQQWMVDMDRRLDPLRDDPAFVELTNRIRDEITRARTEIRSIALASNWGTPSGRLQAGSH
jgi:TolB-like protein/Flp pilus assembly protein TadD